MLSSAKRPNTQKQLVPNSPNNNAGSKISLNHYLKRLHSKSTEDDEVFMKSGDEKPLPHLPTPNELFKGKFRQVDIQLCRLEMAPLLNKYY